MYITPSGIRYEDLTPEKISKVNIRTFQWEGEYKPSSEMMVHAAAYIERPGCSFIAHTHQNLATAAGALRVRTLRIKTPEDESIRIHCAPYALPGTSRLAENVAMTLRKHRRADYIILSNHGTLCLGEDGQDVVDIALELEDYSRMFLEQWCRLRMSCRVVHGYDSHLENGKIVYEQDDVPYRIRRVHERIYARRHDIRYVVHNRSEACTIVSDRCAYMKPLLDDFAQLIGTGIRNPVNFNGRDGSRIIVDRHVNAVLSPGDGAFCMGGTAEDADATAIVMEKGCLTQIAAVRFGNGAFLSRRDCMKMNRHYRNSFSRLADVTVHSQ
jgi:L-fuculose-phosphate aldolase